MRASGSRGLPRFCRSASLVETSRLYPLGGIGDFNRHPVYTRDRHADAGSKAWIKEGQIDTITD